MIEVVAFISFAALTLVWAFAPSTPRHAEEPAATAATKREALA